MTVERTSPPRTAGERETLESWLDFHRATLARKCAGLTDEQLREQSAPPSDLSLLGLVRHMAETERGWFRQVLGGEDVPDLYVTPEDQNAEFTGAATADVAASFAAWQTECELARKAVAAAPSLDVLAARRPGWARPRCAGSWCT